VIKKGKFMIKKVALIILVIVVTFITILVIKKQNGDAILQGTKVMEFVDDIQVESTSDFLFETVNDQKIEMNVEDRFFKIKGMENKTVFLKVFGWDCKFCKKEIPELIKLKKELGESFEVIAIEAQQFSREESLSFMKEYGINYHIIPGESQAAFYQYLQEKYGWTGVIPLTIVLGKDGQVLAFEIGAKSFSLAELMKASLTRS
jgi:thiol-disulfide isomerase/thioredoxin